MSVSKKLKKYFDGKRVGVIMKSIRGSQEVDGTTFHGNQVVDGYYIDEDETYLFMCDEEGDIVEALAKRDIVRMFIQNELNDGTIPEEMEIN